MAGREYLQAPDITDDERRKLSALGATSLLALVHMIRAAASSFRALVGLERADAIEQALVAALTPEEKALLDEPPRRFPLGVAAGPPPPLRAPAFDVARRDRLFRELQSLRAGADPQADARAKEIKRELDALLARSAEPPKN